MEESAISACDAPFKQKQTPHLSLFQRTMERDTHLEETSLLGSGRPTASDELRTTRNKTCLPEFANAFRPDSPRSCAGNEPF
jgi:hypothetical protein